MLSRLYQDAVSDGDAAENYLAQHLFQPAPRVVSDIGKRLFRPAPSLLAAQRNPQAGRLFRAAVSAADQVAPYVVPPAVSPAAIAAQHVRKSLVKQGKDYISNLKNVHVYGNRADAAQHNAELLTLGDYGDPYSPSIRKKFQQQFNNEEAYRDASHNAGMNALGTTAGLASIPLGVGELPVLGELGAAAGLLSTGAAVAPGIEPVVDQGVSGIAPVLRGALRSAATERVE